MISLPINASWPWATGIGKVAFAFVFLLGGFPAYDTFGCPVQPYTCFEFTESEGMGGSTFWFTWSLSSILAEDSVSMPPTAGTTFYPTKFLSLHHIFLVPRPRSQFHGGERVSEPPSFTHTCQPCIPAAFICGIDSMKGGRGGIVSSEDQYQ